MEDTEKFHTFYVKIGKRICDIILSIFALLILSPAFYIIIILLILKYHGNPFFIQRRFGRDLKPFKLIKFRSMVSDSSTSQKDFEPGCTNRVTPVGRILRKTKIDELPELYNVLIGDMSIVGPRPEVDKYIQIYKDEFDNILKNKPGLSDFASIKYRDEETILSQQKNADEYYIKVILPDKLRLARIYSKSVSLGTDLNIIKKTIRTMIRSKK